VIETRRAQRSFGDGLIAAEVTDLREAWITPVDALLADDAIVAAVYSADLRLPNSGPRGAPEADAAKVSNRARLSRLVPGR
jgi:transposase, IS5 family